jgi:hypothetical protein
MSAREDHQRRWCSLWKQYIFAYWDKNVKGTNLLGRLDQRIVNRFRIDLHNGPKSVSAFPHFQLSTITFSLSVQSCVFMEHADAGTESWGQILLTPVRFPHKGGVICSGPVRYTIKSASDFVASNYQKSCRIISKKLNISILRVVSFVNISLTIHLFKKNNCYGYWSYTTMFRADRHKIALTLT